MIRRVFAAAVIVSALSACQESQAPPPPDVKPASVEISPSTAVIYAWQETKFSAVVKNAAGTVLPGARVRWESNDSSLIVIDSNGSGYVNLFYPMTEASATVSAISVENANARSQRAFTIKIQYSDLGIVPDTNALLVGMGRTLSANIQYFETGSSPEGRQRVMPTWSSAAPGIVTVNDSGQITAVATGHARITATYDSMTATSEVDVVASPSVQLTRVSGGVFITQDASVTRVNRECGLNAKDGGVYCWGLLVPEMLPFDRCEFVLKTGPTWRHKQFHCGEIPAPLPAPVTFSALSSGGFGGCALATTKAVYCWGTNGSGELGNGTTDQFTFAGWVDRGATKIASDDQFRSVHSGGPQRCAIRTDGAAFCWGIGFGSAPTRVSGNVSFTTIAERSRYDGNNCGLAVDNTAYCWSNSQSSQQIGTSQWVGIDVNLVSACALAASGRAYCWAFGTSGIGQSPTLVSGDPALVFMGTMVEASNFNYSSTCGLSAAGDTYCIKATGTSPNYSYSLEAVNLGGLKLKRFSGTCGIGLDDKAYCWTYDRRTVRPIPGQ
jgi:hypothetical protein